MDKPMMLKREELAKNIIQCINDADLHPCIVEPILSSILDELRDTMQKLYDSEKTQYENALKEETEKSN